MNKNFGTFDRFLSIPTTSPLRSAQDVYSALDKLENTNADVCISVTPSSRSPFFNMVKSKGKNYFELAIQSKNKINRRQDSPKIFDITTVVYAAKVDFIKHHDSIFLAKWPQLLFQKTAHLILMIFMTFYMLRLY